MVDIYWEISNHSSKILWNVMLNLAEFALHIPFVQFFEGTTLHNCLTVVVIGFPCCSSFYSSI